MDKRSLLAIVLSFLILIGYQEIVSYFYPPAKKTAPTEPTEPAAPSVSPVPQQAIAEKTEEQRKPVPPVEAQASIPAQAERTIAVENEVYRAIFTSLGGRLKSLRLKNYPGDAGRDSPPLEMVRQGAQGELPLEVRLEGQGTTTDDDAVPYEVRGGDIQLRGNEQATVEFRGKSRNGALITKAFSFSGQTYGMTMTVAIEGAPENTSALSLLWTQALSATASSYEVHGPVALVGRKFIYEAAFGLAGEEKLLGPGRVRWAGYADTYFVAAMIPPEGEEHRLLFRIADKTVETKLTVPWNREPVAYTLYVGPKDFQALNAVHPALDRAVDFGWFHFIARPLLSLLKFSHSLTGNYGIDVILLTILVKLAFFPLSEKSFQSMGQMRKLQPQMERLREQYKDDREKLNKEMMELYRRYKVNPLGGCLPMLIQLPVFIGLYQALSYAIELRQAPFFGWIQDLSRPDRLGALALPFVEPPGIPVLTILMGGTMFMQQAMTPMTGDPLQQKMMMFMPLIFTLMFVNFPAGLVLYWLVNNVLSIAQQYAYTKRTDDNREGGKIS